VRPGTRGALPVLAVLSVAAVLVSLVPVSVAEASGSARDATSTLFVVRNKAINEDSALVRRKRLFVTTNDSGDTGRLFVLGRTGRTVGVTRWSDNPHDCEALAPGGPGHVWVGDIGDNTSHRRSISVSRVPVGRGDRTVKVPKYRLVYPGGPSNAETLVRHPRTGRLYIATKSANGGALYAVPRSLSRRHTNVLRRVGPVLPVATDGAFLPGGNFLVIRSYARAELYRWPSMASLGSFPLPGQTQGEGLTVGSAGAVLLSSEGVDQPVLRTLLPVPLRRIVKADG
jgi:hypothetical protein